MLVKTSLVIVGYTHFVTYAQHFNDTAFSSTRKKNTNIYAKVFFENLRDVYLIISL